MAEWLRVLSIRRSGHKKFEKIRFGGGDVTIGVQVLYYQSLHWHSGGGRRRDGEGALTDGAYGTGTEPGLVRKIRIGGDRRHRIRASVGDLHQCRSHAESNFGSEHRNQDCRKENASEGGECFSNEIHRASP